MEDNYNLLDMEPDRDSFLFYVSWYKWISTLKKRAQILAFTAICEYSLFSKPIPKEGFSLSEYATLCSFVPIMKKHKANYENGKKGAVYGCKGGRPKMSETPTGLSDKTATGLRVATPTDTVSVNHAVTEKETDDVTDTAEVETTDMASCFKELEDELLAIFFFKNNCHPAPELKKFYEFYNGRGWKLGGGKVIDSMEALKDIFMKNYDGGEVERDDPFLEKLIELVNRHTYTVELLAQHMENSGQTAQEMIEALEKEGILSLNEEVRNADMKTQIAYENLLKMFKLFSLNEEEKQILMYLSLMPIEGVNIRDFREWAGLKSAKMINSLKGRSWIIENTAGIALHPVVKDVVKHECDLSFESCKILFDNLSNVFNSIWSIKPEKRSYYGTIAKSLYSAKNNIEYSEVKLYFSIFYIFEHLDYNNLCESLLQKLETLLSEKQEPLTGGYYYYAGDYQLHKMHYNKALECLEVSQKIFEKLNPNSFELAYILKHIAHTYHAMYEHEARNIKYVNNAKKYLEKSRKIFESCIDDMHPQMGSQFYAEGLNFYYLGDYEKALINSQKSFDIFMKLHGEMNSDTTAPMRVLARIYSKINCVDKAIDMQMRVIRVRETLWSKNQFKYFEQLETLSDIYVENNMIEQGIETLENLINLIENRSDDYKFYLEKLNEKLSVLKEKETL